MSNHELDNMKEFEMETNMAQQKHKTSPLALILGIIAIIMFGAASFFAGKSTAISPAPAVQSPNPAAGKSQKAEPPAKPVYKLEDFKREVEKFRSEHNAGNQKLFADFKRNLQAAGENNFAMARNNISGTINHFCNFKSCATLVYTMARDKIKNTQKAQEQISSVLKDRIVVHCAAGGAAVQDVTADFIHRLQENDNRFRSKCAAELKKFPAESKDLASAQNFVADLEKFNKQVENYLVSSAFTAVGTVLEAVLIKQTIAAFVRILGPVVIKVSGSAAAPFLDGPLPIGDIIAIGGLIWCTYDIYQVIHVLPRQMRNSLLGAITNYSKNVRAEALAKAEKALAHSVESAQKVVSELQ